MKEIKKAQFSKGGQGGGYTIKVSIPKQMADAIELTQDDLEVMIELKGNQIIITKGFELMEEKNGTVEFNGKEYALTQDAYIAGTIDAPFFEAMAIDKKGNEYIVRWEIVREAELEEDMCDWHDPVSVEKL